MNNRKERIMEASLEILTEQIQLIKDKYNILLGECANVFEFSNYTISPERNIKHKTIAHNLNKKIAKIYDYMLDLKKTIDEI